MSLQTNYTGAVHSQLSTGDDPAMRLMTPMLTEDPITPESRHSRNNSHPSHRLRLSYLGKKKKKDNISQVIWKATVGSDYNLSKAAEVSMVMWRMVIFPSIKKNNFIYLFWLCWIFTATPRLSLVVASRDYSLWQCMGFSLPRLLLLQRIGSRAQGLG